MSENKNVLFLAFRNDSPTETIEHLCCKTCHNKTYVAVYDNTSKFPKLKCSVCNSKIGYFGWVKDEEAEEDNKRS